MEDTKKLIEKYKRELMELCRTPSSPESAAPESVKTASEQEPSMPEEKTAAPAEEPAAEVAPCGEEKKPPQIIGYVSDTHSGFAEMFDKYFVDDEESADKSIKDDCAEEHTTAPAENEKSSAECDDSAAGSDDSAPTDSLTADDDLVSSPEKLFEQMRGTDEEESGYESSEFADYEAFTEHNTGTGTLEFRVFTAEQALPVKSARVTVTVKIGGTNREMFSDSADESGETVPCKLPAPSRELSQQPYNRVQPFSLYDAKVECDGYDTVILRDIPIFDGVQSVQRVAMIPSAAEQKGRGIADGE